MIFKVCDKCKAVNINSLVPKLKEINPNANIDIRCHNFCGVGRSRPFVIIDHIPVIADTEEELIKKVKENVEKNNS